MNMTRTFLAMLLPLFIVAPAVAVEISDSHRKATIELFESNGVKEAIDQQSQIMIEGMITPLGEIPCLGASIDEVSAFILDKMSYEALKPEMIQIYAKHFTEAEIKEWLAFTKTPLGQKVIAKTPVLAGEGMVIGQQIMAKEEPNLRKIFEKYVDDEGNCTQPK